MNLGVLYPVLVVVGALGAAVALLLGGRRR